jgi:hypothetical protein
VASPTKLNTPDKAAQDRGQPIGGSADHPVGRPKWPGGRCARQGPGTTLNSMNTTSLSADRSTDHTAFGSVRLLVGTYLTISVLTLVAIVLLRDHPSMVNSAVWTRGIIVVASALLTTLFAARAARGHQRAFLRLRIVSAVMVVAIAVIIAIPGTFPLWMKIEQGVCGLVLVGVVVQVNSRRVRSLFAAGRG